jgi:hypothetical protein
MSDGKCLLTDLLVKYGCEVRLFAVTAKRGRIMCVLTAPGPEAGEHRAEGYGQTAPEAVADAERIAREDGWLEAARPPAGPEYPGDVGWG